MTVPLAPAAGRLVRHVPIGHCGELLRGVEEDFGQLAEDFVGIRPLGVGPQYGQEVPAEAAGLREALAGVFAEQPLELVVAVGEHFARRADSQSVDSPHEPPKRAAMHSYELWPAVRAPTALSFGSAARCSG